MLQHISGLIDLAVIVLIGSLFYLNLFFNPFLWYKEHRTPEEVQKVLKQLLIVIHVVILGVLAVLVLI